VLFRSGFPDQALKTQVDIFELLRESLSNRQAVARQAPAPGREDRNCHQGSMLRKDCT